MGISIETENKVYSVLLSIEQIYYPLLAVVAVPANLVTIVILCKGNCGLSKCITSYMVAMAVSDLLVSILDLILRHIPITFKEHSHFLESIPLCNIHAVLLYAATDCSVWFTVTFTFDRFVAICCQKMKTKYCTERTAAVVLGTVNVLSCLKNIFWYFMLTECYVLVNQPWFCLIRRYADNSPFWVGMEFFYSILTPGVPFVLILLCNILTVRHIIVTSRGRKRLRAPSSGASPRDPEMVSRRNSILLLLFVSANFALLWSLLMLHSIWIRMEWLYQQTMHLHSFVLELSFILQLLSCCTNTEIYAVTQTRFRKQFIIALGYRIGMLREIISRLIQLKIKKESEVKHSLQF